MSIIKGTNLTKQIGNFHLGPINFSVAPGTITALIGNNGSGKSTLMKIMMNLVKPDTGEILIDQMSVDSAKETWKQFVGYQAQSPVGYGPFTGEALQQMIGPLYPNWDDHLFLDIVDELQIDLKQTFGKSSPGAQQKLAFALTIARQTPLLILDEPTAHLDIPAKKVIIDRLVEAMDQGERSIIISSHQVYDIKKLADYLFIIHNGRQIGHYEKGALTEKYVRYWLEDPIDAKSIPGVIATDHLSITSENSYETEKYLLARDISWISREQLDLDEIITILLSK